eukprot:TRINITY_DN21141_c0_g1_i1.p1 TRINITY_DN21141_c0_g1~~TRINITY_DN21141_c0_g1_i1.p1  ORF type:complete len:458 (-),score=111.62 TRINITY_DN21141_c0_g1_i1:279-1652(-)
MSSSMLLAQATAAASQGLQAATEAAQVVAQRSAPMAQQVVAYTANMKDESMKMIQQRVAQEYGNEVFEMMNSLLAVMQKVSADLKLSEMQYGMMLAFPMLHFYHDTVPFPATSADLKTADPDLAGQAKHWADFAAGAYGGEGADDVAKVQAKLGGLAKVRMAALPAAGVQCPGHYVAVDSERGAVVLGVRGTVNLSDAITDAVGNSVPFPEYPGVETHQAILAAAREVLNRTKADLHEALKNNEGCGLVVCGHSLGAGTSILCALLLATEQLPGKPKIRCFAYAPPPVISDPTDAKIRTVEINAFVNRYDIVPRLSLHNVYMLGREAVAVDKMVLSLTERIDLVRKKSNPDEAFKSGKEQIMAVAAAERQKVKGEKHAEFKPHFIPGRVYWLDSDKQPVQVLQTTDKEFQAINIRGRVESLEDHRMGNYCAGFQDLPQAGPTFPEGGVSSQCQCTVQ